MSENEEPEIIYEYVEKSAGAEVTEPEPDSDTGVAAGQSAVGTTEAPVETSIVPSVVTGGLVMSLSDAVAQIDQFEQFMTEVLKDGVDYGIPECAVCNGTGKKDGNKCGACKGTGKNQSFNKPFLWKSGANWSLRVCGLYADPDVDVQQSIVDYNADPPLFHYVVKVNIRQRGTDLKVGAGVGACSSREKKYGMRYADRVCPTCNEPTIKRSQFREEWYCHQKAGGCNAKFPIDDERITGQKQGQIPNQDTPELINTIIKMAVKRATVDGALQTTSADRYFTQDEDAMESMGTIRQPPDPARPQGGAVTSTPESPVAAPPSQPSITVEHEGPRQLSNGEVKVQRENKAILRALSETCKQYDIPLDSNGRFAEVALNDDQCACVGIPSHGYKERNHVYIGSKDMSTKPWSWVWPLESDINEGRALSKRQVKLLVAYDPAENYAPVEADDGPTDDVPF